VHKALYLNPGSPKQREWVLRKREFELENDGKAHLAEAGAEGAASGQLSTWLLGEAGF